ncbi:MAG: 4Fe-4S dicluster domain-containing protein [Candidatus Eisenbacteria bacterium]
MQRRGFLKWMGLAPGTLVATSDWAGAADQLISHLVPPAPGLLPGESARYRSFCTECPEACGLLVEVRQGHPVKLEGDPACPHNRGGLCMRGQASLARLYHPQRIRGPLARDAHGAHAAISWDEALGRIDQALLEARGMDLASLYLSGRTSGSLAELQKEFARTREVHLLPQIEIFHHGALRRANEILFGRAQVPEYRLTGPAAAPAGESRVAALSAGGPGADLLITLGADIFESFLNPVRFAAEYAASRHHLVHWFHLEPGLSLTGAQADMRVSIHPGSEAHFLAYLLRSILIAEDSTPSGGRGPASFLSAESRTALIAALPDVSSLELATRTGIPPATAATILALLRGARRPLLICGGVATAHANGLQAALLAGLLQAVTGQIGTTVDFGRAANLDRVGTPLEISARARDLSGRGLGVCFLSRLHTLALVPAVKTLLADARLTVGMIDFLYPPFADCDLLLPLSHGLESDQDAEPTSGLKVRGRAVFSPLFDTLPEGEILLRLMRDVRNAHGDFPGGGEYRAWLQSRWESEGWAEEENCLVLASDAPDAVITRDPVPAHDSAGVQEPAPGVRLDVARAVSALRETPPALPERGPALVLGPSLRMYDGRSRPITLLHEIPDPLASISYGDYVCLSSEPATAPPAHDSGSQMGNAPLDRMADGDVLALHIDSGKLEWPVRRLPVLNPGYFVAPLDQVLNAEASHALQLAPLTGELIRVLAVREARPAGPRVALPVLSGSLQTHGHAILPGQGHGHGAQPPRSLYPPHQHAPYRWAMAIDLDKCIACSACVAACYVENNVALSGLKEHLRGREMSWIRLEPYHRDDGRLRFMLMLCQHCDNAPCETVCPVYATYHNPDGLNAQVYNRCVGTRYCSNNCPYKVRRFNWFEFERPAPLDLLVNPEVWVRPKGVMEKCSFCIQRIRAAKDRAKDADRLVADGEVVPACAQSCPTQAIVFGNLMDEQSRVAALARRANVHRVLEDLGTEPAIYYLPKREAAVMIESDGRAGAVDGGHGDREHGG